MEKNIGREKKKKIQYSPDYSDTMLKDHSTVPELQSFGEENYFVF